MKILILTEEQNIHWFIYNFMDLYVIKISLFTAKRRTVISVKSMAIAIVSRTNKYTANIK